MVEVCQACMEEIKTGSRVISVSHGKLGRKNTVIGKRQTDFFHGRCADNVAVGRQ